MNANFITTEAVQAGLEIWTFIVLLLGGVDVIRADRRHIGVDVGRTFSSFILYWGVGAVLILLLGLMF